MNLRALFQRLVPPKKAGTPVPMVVKRPQMRKYELEFTNLEDSPRYPLDATFTVGSEVGELVLDHHSVSPRHATFDFKGGLATVMDQGSVEGSQLNGSPLPKGRTVILEAGDEIQLGDVMVILHGVEGDEAEDEIAEAPPLPEAPATGPALVEETPVAAAVDPVIRPTAGRGNNNLDKRLEQVRKKKVVAKIIGGGSTRAANTLPRVLAIAMDGVWAVVLWQVLSPFDEFLFIVEILPRTLQEMVLPLLEQEITNAGMQDAYAGVLGFLAPLEAAVEFSHLLSVWWLARVCGTLLFGISVGSFMVGIRADGNAVWKRAGGVLREVVGLVTAPFLVFDLPALLSRRTLKEIVTLTQLYTPSSGAVVISLLMFSPIALTCLLLSPLLAGLEIPEPVPVMNVRAKKDRRAPEAVAVTRTAVPSGWFGAEFQVDLAQWWVLPRFSWGQSGNKRALTPTLVFYQEGGAVVPLVLEHKFEWATVLGHVLQHNPFAQNSYPTLWRYIQSSKINDQGTLGFRPTKADETQFPAEVQALVETAFTLSLVNVVDHVQTHGPMIKGYMRARQALQNLIRGAEGSWSFRNMGGTSFMVFEVVGKKSYDLIIPLTMGGGRMFRLNYSSPKERAKVSNLAMRELWTKANWKYSGASNAGLVGWIDVVARLAGKDAASAGPALEGVFGAYFEAAAAVVSLAPDAPRRQAVAKSLKNSVDVLAQLERAKGRGRENFPTENVVKLRERLNDLKARLEAGDAAYFSTETTP